MNCNVYMFHKIIFSNKFDLSEQELFSDKTCNSVCLTGDLSVVDLVWPQMIVSLSDNKIYFQEHMFSV